MIKISIVTPVYNGEAFIEGCIQNVIEQGNLDRIEHIIQDANSSDGTVYIIKKYAKDFSHIRLVSESDEGQADALNKGTSIARGEIVGSLNVDDRYAEGLIEKVLGWMEEAPKPRFIYGNCRIWDENGCLVEENIPRGISFETLLSPDYPFPCNALGYFYDKSAHDRIGGYDVSEHYALDHDFLIRILRATIPSYYDQLFGEHYRHEQCKTQQSIQDGTNVEFMNNAYQKNLEKLTPYEHARLTWYLTNKKEYSRKNSMIFHLFFLTKNPVYFFKLIILYLKERYLDGKLVRFGFFH